MTTTHTRVRALEKNPSVGGRKVDLANIKVPILCLFGEKDSSIPLAEVDAIRNRLAMQRSWLPNVRI